MNLESNSLTIYFGKGFAFKTSLGRDHCQQLLAKFKRREVPIGTTRTGPAEDSVGYWIEQHAGKVALACYVGAVLVHEGYAERYGSVIRFK